jgi:phage terminase Nu1 subunit (DNA packaging protein)
MSFDFGKKNMVSPQQLGNVIKLSGERVRQLADEGIFEVEKNGRNRRLDLFPSIQLYIEYLRKQMSPTRNMNDEERKLKADADWKEAKADIEAMKRDEIKGSLHSSDDVLKITLDMVMAVRASLLALPGMCAMDCANAQTAAEASGIIKNAVNDILNGLTEYEYDPEKYKELVRERETWIRADNEE